jgi:glycosyltransferase involved in cell wall biosynthesis
VTSVLDLIPVLFPEDFDTPLDGRLLYRWRLRSAIRSAGIITLSASAKRDIVTGLKYPEERITATHLAPASHFKPLDVRARDTRLAKLGLSQGYILYVGGYSRRKNVRTLLAAFKRVSQQMPDQQLVLGGAAKAAAKAVVEAEISALGVSGKVIWTGALDDEGMVTVYNGARIFVYPSLYEGFGLPVVEAMACGIPVVASGRSSLPELVGDSGILVDPLDIEHLAEQTLSLLRSPGLRSELSSKGIARASQFTWDRCARATVEAYERAALHSSANRKNVA